LIVERIDKMAIQKIEEIYLYVSEASSNSAENIQAVAFMDHSGIPYTRMMYGDISQHEDVFSSLNTWWQHNPNVAPVTSFPFLTYVEVHDDIPARQSPVKNLQRIDEIKTIVDIVNSISNKD